MKHNNNLNIDEAFMSRADMAFDTLPTKWTESLFTGNGELGAMVYLTPDKKALRWHLGKVDLQDHRSHDGNKDGLPDHETLHSWSWSCFHWTDPRLDLGAIELVPVGQIEDGWIKLNLWNAELTGQIKTSLGTISFRSLTHTEHMVEILEYWTSDQERGATVRWQPSSADAPRHQMRHYYARHDGPKPLPGYVSNPEPVLSQDGDINICTQALLAGGDYATAYARREIEPGHFQVFTTTVNSVPQTGSAKIAADYIRQMLAKDFDDLIATHRKWWNAFYPQSGISIPDEKLLSFYWVQIYKLGSATRSDRSLIDNTGPWYVANAWAYVTWDMNLQLCYWPMYGGNRLNLAGSLRKFFERTLDQHIAAVPEEWQHDSAGNPGISNQRVIGGEFAIKGCLPWALHNLWLEYRHGMDETLLTDVLYPYLHRAMCYYAHLMFEGDDGYLHLPEAMSPEYPVKCQDTTFDLSLFRWGCQTLLWSNEHLGLDDEKADTWRDVLERLVPYHQNQDGWLIGKDTPYEVSHRHHQHIMPFYPLHLVNWDQPENRQLIEKSVRHWLSLPDELEGFSFTGAASHFAMMRKPEEIVPWIYKLINDKLHQNTMYTEWPEDPNPVIETPISVTVTLHEMMLQSWGDRIRTFPAIPKDWEDVAFNDLRAEGAYIVSGQRTAGKTDFVRISAEHDGLCRLECDIENPIIEGIDQSRIKNNQGIWEIKMKAGQSFKMTTPKGNN